MPQRSRWFGLLTAIAVFSATAVYAQPLQFGDRISLTATRYADPGGEPLLASNGVDTFLFLATPTSLRAARLTEEHPVPRPVLDTTGGGAVAWNGQHFLAVANSGSAVIGRLLDAAAQPAGAPFTIVQDATAPRLASDGHRFVLLYEAAGEVRSLTLDENGTPDADARTLGFAASDYAIASNGNGFAALAAQSDGVHLLTLGSDGAVTAETTISANVANAVSITSDAHQYVALWSHSAGVDAAELHDGIASAPFSVSSAPTASLASLWDGTYEMVFRAGELRRMRIDPLTRTAGADSVIAPLGAADQQLVATASSADSTLFVWNETADVHAGLRLRGGAWRESVLTHGKHAVAAAAGSEAFLVVTETDGGWVAHLLDLEGKPLSVSSRQAFRARGVTAAGNAWVVFGEDATAGVVAARIEHDGSVGQPVVIRNGATEPTMASDGTNLFAVSRIADGSLEGVRLNEHLAPLDGTTILVTSSGATPSVMFNGTSYTLVWADAGFIKGRRIRTDGTVVGEFVQIGHGGENPTGVRLTRLGARTGLTWFDGNAQALILDVWTVNSAKTFAARSGEAPLVAMLPEETIAYAQTDSVDDIPYYGANRLLLAVGDVTPPGPDPEAPVAQLTLSAGKLHIEWTAPPQPVRAYRVEYRVDEGPWLEADGVIAASTQTLTFAPWSSGTWTFRVRAVNDSGAGAYSNVVERQYIVSRRRAVR